MSTYEIVGCAALVGAALFVWAAASAWRAKRKTKFTWMQFLLMLPCWFFCFWLWRLKIEGEAPREREGGMLVVCNHRSPFEPWFIACAFDEMVRWMVAREYCEHGFFGPVLRRLRAIPASRTGVDTAATKTAINHAQQGGLVGMLPEGRINMTDAVLLSGRPGAAMVALKAKVPILPCYVDGAPYDGTVLGNLYKRARVRLIVGQPIDLSPYFDREQDRDALEEITRLAMREIARLGGVDDFTPEIAGRRWKPEE